MPTKTTGFSAEEKAAARERVKELKAAAQRVEGETALLAKIAEMKPSDRAIAERIHAVVKGAAPELSATTWYGMPAYSKDGTLVCHFQPAEKFKTRYATLGFSDKANLDEGAMWANAFALTEVTPAEEKRIAALIKRAIS